MPATVPRLRICGEPTVRDAIARPGLLPIAGGTDVMVEINFDRRRPEGLLDLTRVGEIGTWSVEDGVVRMGAGVTYAQVESDLGELVPALALSLIHI